MVDGSVGLILHAEVGLGNLVDAEIDPPRAPRPATPQKRASGPRIPTYPINYCRGLYPGSGTIDTSTIENPSCSTACNTPDGPRADRSVASFRAELVDF
jgi:hypothetical protein